MDFGNDETAIRAAADFGIGARVTLAVMADDFAGRITAALTDTDATGLRLETDQVSTFVRGDEQRICDYLTRLIAAAARGGGHLSAGVLLSRGCPGEVCRVVDALPAATAPELAPTGVTAVAQWALYPLADSGSHGLPADHMRDITAVIEQAKERGTFLRGDHFVTTLAGDVADIIGTVAAGWIAVGRHVQHVATHVTLSIGSPTEIGPATPGSAARQERS